MKIKPFALALILKCIFFSAQNTKAVMEINYETKLIRDSLNKEKINFTNYTLLTNNTESAYFNREAKDFFNISDTKKEKNVIMTSVGAIPKYPRSVGSVQKFNNQLIVSLPVGKYIYTFEEPELTWELLNETKDIKGFKCRLAKTITDTNDTFFAWYTEDIPIPDGPFRFKGLSGLILEVYNKNKTIEIYATDIKKSDENIASINYRNDVKTKSKQQYLDARKNYIV